MEHHHSQMQKIATAEVTLYKTSKNERIINPQEIHYFNLTNNSH